MVVLESGSMLHSTNNQYLHPDYLSSLPTTLDAKKSPLALLAQTCSQIGADTSTTKPVNSSNEKSKKTSDTVRSSPTDQTNFHMDELLSPENKLLFKSTDKNTTVKRSDINRGKCSVKNPVEQKTIERYTPEGKTASPNTSFCDTPNCEFIKNSSEQESTTCSTGSASPVIKSAIEILHEHTKDALPNNSESMGLNNSNNGSLNSACCFSNIEQLNPAFRSPFTGPAYNINQNTGLFNSGYPNTTSGLYSNYFRVKTPSGGEALLPTCKEPYCTGCQYNVHNQHLLINHMSGSCPSGCTQCDHQKFNLALTMPFTPSTAPSTLSYTSLVRPYICNWILGDAYCGKRFVTSEDLLQHLRSHTNGFDTNSTSTSASLLNPLSLYTATSIHRPAYMNSINPLQSGRYHPYNKTALQTLIGSYSAFSPTVFGSYYSSYPLYGQRIGAAAVHP